MEGKNKINFKEKTKESGIRIVREEKTSGA